MIPPWGGEPVQSGTLICFKGDPRAPYAVFSPIRPDLPNGQVTITQSGAVWIVSIPGPAGEPYQTIIIPVTDCIQLQQVCQ